MRTCANNLFDFGHEYQNKILYNNIVLTSMHHLVIIIK